MPHKQTHRRQILDEQMVKLIRQRHAAGLSVQTAHLRETGVAGGSCRVSKLRQQVMTGWVPIHRRAGAARRRRRLPENGSVVRAILGAVHAFLRRGLIDPADRQAHRQAGAAVGLQRQ